MFSISFDPFSFITAIAATWLAWEAFKRSHYVTLKLIKCDGSAHATINENNREFFQQLSIAIRNDGIPLHGLRVYFRFLGDKQPGTWSIELSPSGKPNKEANLSTGMVAKFHLKSYVIGEQAFEWFDDLTDPIKQRAEFVIMTQDDYTAARIPIGRWYHRLLNWWTPIAWRVNFYFKQEKGVNEQGTPTIYIPTILPTFETNLRQFESFLKGLRRSAQNQKPKSL